MGKLFSNESDNTDELMGRFTRDGKEVDILSLQEAESSVGLAVEQFKPIQYYYDSVKHIESALSSKSPVLAAENYNPFLKALASNLGIKAPIPALEDYRNEYSAKASQEVALEGIKDIIKRMWEAIRKFFADFFKKVNEFARRLINANLEIDTYERYVPDLLKKISSNKLKCSDPKKEVNTKLVKLLAPEGIEKLDGVWVPQNIKPIINEVNVSLEFLTKKMVPKLINVHLNEFKSVIQNGYNSISSNMTEESLLKQLDEIEVKIKNTIITITSEFCQNEISERDLPASAYEQLSDLLVDNKLSDLTIRSFSNPKSRLTRLPKNFNLIMGISNESKVYSVSVTEDNENKTTTIPVLSELKALEIVFEQYKELSKKFDTKVMYKMFNDVEKALNAFLVQTPKELERFKDKYSKFTLGMSSFTLPESINEVELKNLIFAVQERLYDLDLELYNEWKHLFMDKVSDYTLDDFKNIRVICSLLVKRLTDPDEVAKLSTEHSALIQALIYYCDETMKQIDVILMNTTNEKTTEVDLSKVVMKKIDDVEKMVINFVQNLQIALRSVETTFPNIVTELRYELLKYVYDSAKQFE